jgi:NADH dehydrogenase
MSDSKKGLSITHNLVILGAGYSGLAATKRLAHRLRGADVALTLINATDRFTERVRLYQLAAGQALPDRPLRDVLAGCDVALVVARGIAIDLRTRTVRLDDTPHELRYDTLVNAVGSTADVEGTPGVRDHAFTVADTGQATLLSSHLAGRTTTAGRLAVVGGGLSGIETATELAEAHPDLRVELVTAGPLGGWLSGHARRYLHQVFERRSIGVHEGVRVGAVDAGALLLDNGRDLSADTVVWTAGFRAASLARRAGLAVDERGRMAVDDMSRSTSHPEVYGIGDAAAAPVPGGGHSRMSCQTGLPMGCSPPTRSPERSPEVAPGRSGSASSGRTSAWAATMASPSSPGPTTARSTSSSPAEPPPASRRPSPAAPPI